MYQNTIKATVVKMVSKFLMFMEIIDETLYTGKLFWTHGDIVIS